MKLLAGFENCTLVNEAFHHEQHVRVAFLYLCRYSALEALERFSTALARFATAHGKTTLYNETVTWAYILLIRERMARAGRTHSWLEFRAGKCRFVRPEAGYFEEILPAGNAALRIGQANVLVSRSMRR